jgi:16S rRNA (cytosine967-C5)-methyltransferase
MEKASAWIAHLTKGRVLDLTSAPGGKALHAQDLGRYVVANDLDVRRFAFHELERVRSDARRGGFRRAFDTVILDPDCTGIGRLHSPETRLWLGLTSKRKMSEYQRELIRPSVSYLKRGGILIYSTCTITYEENEGHEELMESLGLKPVEIEVASKGLKKGWRRFLPNLHETIGFTFSVHELY